MENSPARYPGVAPFAENQQGVFYGRNREVNIILHLMADSNQVLLYSKSGVGKTSLIKAGLLERFKQDPQIEYKLIRFGNFVKGESEESNRETPLENIFRRIEKARSPTILSKLVPNFRDSLWSRYKILQTDDQKHHILIFDQFEELFTYPKEQIHALKVELAELLDAYIPPEFQKALQDQQDSGKIMLSKAEIVQLYEPINVKILVAIREDRLSDILQLNDYLPDLRHNFFELRPLDRERAREAIEKPAREHGNFVSHPFAFSPEAVSKILDFLELDGQPIETTQLQIICHQVEKIRQIFSEEPTFVFPEAELPEFKDLMKGFYFSVLEKVDESKREATRRFVEDVLIHSGQRIPVAEQVCESALGKEGISMLAAEHLLRPEPNSTKRLSYELSHDTLVDPILALKEERHTQELLNKAALEKKENERKIFEKDTALEKERKLAQRLRSVIVLFFVTCFVAFGLFVYALTQKNVAQKNADEADHAKKVAIKSATDLRREKVSLDSTNQELRKQQAALLETEAVRFWNANEKKRALGQLEEAIKLQPYDARLKKKRDKWKQEI